MSPVGDDYSRTDSMIANMHEFDNLLRWFASEEFDKTVCIMAVPAEDDPVHGIGPNDKHATILYFGDYDKHEDPGRMESAKGLLQEVLTKAVTEQGPFVARVTGIEDLGNDDPKAKVWKLDSPELQRLFEEIPEIDSEVQSLYDGADATRYPEFTAHVTIGYGDEAPLQEAQQVKEIEFDRLSLWWGDEHIDFPLGAGEFDALLDRFGGTEVE